MKKKLFILIFLCFFVFSSCSSEKKHWEKAELNNTIEDYEIFLDRHPSGELAEEARLKIEELYFLKAKTISEYKDFLKRYPQGAFTERAYLRILEKINTIQACEDFLKRYPQGTLADKVALKLEELYFDRAQLTMTIPAYEDFLNRYSQGSLADKTRLCIEKLYNERHPTFRNTRTVKITVKQSYGKAEDVSLPFEAVAQKLAKYAGLNLVGADDKDYDVTLKIQARGNARGAYYTRSFPYSLAGYQYSGAFLSGMITLEIPGIRTYKKTFEAEIKPPSEIKGEFPTPSDAPFLDAYLNSEFLVKILEMMGKFYGPTCLCAALKEEDLSGPHRYIQYRAKEELIKIGKPAVEPLIVSLKNKDKSVLWEVIGALGEIKDRQAVEPLIVFLHDKDVEIRYSAAEALEKLNWMPKNDKEKISFLIAYQKWDELVKIGKSAVEPLIAALKDADDDVPKHAAKVLGEIKDRRAVEPLIAALDNFFSGEEAAYALEKITGEDFGYNSVEWKKWWKENKKKFLKKK